MIPNVLSIAGSDPSSGAGVQADIKTISAYGCYALAIPTALTIQNTLGVDEIYAPPAAVVAKQIDAIFADSRIDAVKVGMLGSAEIAAAVADRLAAHRPKNLVIDPVLASSSGFDLAPGELVGVIVDGLFPRAVLATPNLPEAARLLLEPAPPESDQSIEEFASRLLQKGVGAVLMKGGHRKGDEAADVLFSGGAPRRYASSWVATRNAHGTGCALSSAIAACLAFGFSLEDAVASAKSYVWGALKNADRLDVGRGCGPLDHFWRIREFLPHELGAGADLASPVAERFRK